MNWIDIDKFIITLIKVAKSKEDTFKTVKAHYKWTDNQTRTALYPLWDRWYVEEKPVKKKPRKKKKDG